jgi:acyl-CoA thioester hydrolase
VVQKLSIHYGVPAKLDDQLSVTTEPVGHGRVWMDFRQRVIRVSDRKELAAADVRVACIALDSGRPRRLPPAMAELLAQNQTPV